MGLIRPVTHLRAILNLPGAVGLRLKEDFIYALSPGVPVRSMNEPKTPPVYWPLGYFFSAASDLLSQKPGSAELTLPHIHSLKNSSNKQTSDYSWTA